MPTMMEFISFKVLGIPLPIWRKKTNKKKFNRFSWRIIQRNRKINRCWFPKETLSKGLKLEIWTKKLWFIDLHKKCSDEIFSFCFRQNQWSVNDLIDVGLIQVQCLMHNGIILWKQRKIDEIKIFLLILLQKVDQTRGWFYTYTLLRL
jgi:isoleucyl-tRNA synthetase